ncbi:hypothetical protein K5L12_02040, partial [Mycolicibacterium austroafricanum]
TINLGSDLRNTPINGIALTRQLRQLLETHLKPIRLTHHTTSASTHRNPQGHNPIQAPATDKKRLREVRLPMPG